MNEFFEALAQFAEQIMIAPRQARNGHDGLQHVSSAPR